MAETKLTTRVSETTSTTGTGTLDLNGAQTAYRAFSTELNSGDETWYLITDSATSPTFYEAGRGTFTTGSPNTLSRDTVTASSNSDNKVSLPIGTAIVTGSPSKEFINRLSAITTQAVTLDEQAAAPTTAANQVAVFAQENGGAAALLVRPESDGTTQYLFDGTIVAPSGAISIASGSLPAANVFDIPNIPAIYRYLSLSISNASSDTASRALRVQASVNNGSSFLSNGTSGSLTINGTSSGVNNVGYAATGNTQSAGTESNMSLKLFGYQSGPFLLSL